MTALINLNRVTAKIIAVVILLIMFGLALTSMAGKSPTFDEQGFIVRGLGYLRGYPHIRVGHPLGLNVLNASFLASDGSVILPVDDPSWSGTSFHRPAELFLWEIGNNVQHIMFLSRLPTIWIGLLLAALGGRWAWGVSRQIWPGILALLFVALDPNILAHTRLATTDLGLAAFAFLAGYTLWRFLKAPNWINILLAGVAMGLLQNTKFTAALFIPLFAIVILIGLGQMWMENRRSLVNQGSLFSGLPWRPLLFILFVYPLAALMTLWAAYGFEIETMPADLPMLSVLSGRTLPLAHHLEQLLDIGGRLRVGTPSFLLGQYSDSGWWYYFPVAFLLKTPLPTLILISWGVIVFIISLLPFKKSKFTHLTALDASALLVPAVGYFAIALTSDINLGYRHILPTLPFLIVFSVVAIFKGFNLNAGKKKVLASSILSLWLIVSIMLNYPDFLAYFNVFAGGPDNGWRSLVDSNLDWGQDLDDLSTWMDENDVQQVWLSYFGEARPEYYGIEYKGLDSFPPRLMNPQARPFFPQEPAPGIYAISATNLQGVHFTNHDQFAWFREMEPLDKLGYSIFLYDVESTGSPTPLLLSDIQMDEILPEDFTLFNSNDIHPRWFDISQAIIFPVEGQSWLVIRSGSPPHDELAPFLESTELIEDKSAAYQIAQFRPPQPFEETLAEFTFGDGQIKLNDVDFSAQANSRLSVMTTWEQMREPRPLKFFVHIIGQDGELISQWDGFAAAWEGWREGDQLIHIHELEFPEGYTVENTNILIGIYNPETGRRWLTENGLDHLAIK